MRSLKHPVFLAALAAVTFGKPLSGEMVRCLTEPLADVEMTSTVPGTVAVIHFGEGAFVEKGEILLELESTSEQLDIQRREVMVENLKATLDRSEMLLQNTSSISLEEVDEARSEYQMSLIELEMARDALAKKRLRAPFTGIVTDLPIEVGEYCEPPQPIVRMVDIRQFYCIANIDPYIAAELNVGDPVAYIAGSNFDNGTGRLPGKIVYISPVVEPASGLLRIKAVFMNPDGKIRPGEGGFLELIPES